LAGSINCKFFQTVANIAISNDLL